MVAPTCIIKGLGMSLSIGALLSLLNQLVSGFSKLSFLDIVDAPGATGDYHTDLLSKGRTAVQTLIEKNYDFGFVHVKAVDDAGHDR